MTTLTLQPDATAGIDTYVTSGTPTQNNATSSTLSMRSGSQTRTAFMKFDLSTIPAGSVILSATLYLWNATQFTNIITFARILAANSGWTEAGATWEYANSATSLRWAGDTGADAGTDAGCTVSGVDFSATDLGAFSTDIGHAVNTQYAASLNTAEMELMLANNYGICARGSAASSHTFRSSDYTVDTTLRPKLVIVYEAPGTVIRLADSLVSYWKLDETSGSRIDSHNANDLTDVNTVTSTTGIIGNAATYVAANSEYLSLASNALVQTGNIDFTFAAWAKLATTGSPRPIVSKYDNVNSKREYLLFADQTTTRFRFIVSPDGTAITSVIYFSSPSTAIWYFLVVWHDSVADTVNLQIDNGLIATAPYTSGVFASDAEFQIGGAQSSSGVPIYMDGDIDEVVFWKRILTSDERTDLYNAGAGRSYYYILNNGAVGKALIPVRRSYYMWTKRR